MMGGIDKRQWSSDMLVRPRDLVDRISGTQPAIVTLPIEAARQKARQSSISYRTPDTRLSLKTGDSFLTGGLSSRPDIYQLRTEICAERRND
jgi:hypothetical protein